jgi:hypothetical protein
VSKSGHIQKLNVDMRAIVQQHGTNKLTKMGLLK